MLGQLDVTLEAVVYGARARPARAGRDRAAPALLAAAVDPDELLRAVRRVSLRSGVTAALATRLVPVLARDARRLADAQRCRAARRRRRTASASLRAVAAGALDRAIDVAATLEVRGYGTGAPAAAPARGRGRATTSRSRPRRSALVALGVAARGRRLGAVRRLPADVAPLGAGVLLLAAALAACALLPFADRRGIGR